MAYVDGFVMCVPKSRLEEYRALAKKSAPIWLEYGATRYVECEGTDVPDGEVTSFPMAVKAGPDDVVFFSWVEYPSKEVRDAASPKIMADPRLEMDPEKTPFNMKTMIYGGFAPVVDQSK